MRPLTAGATALVLAVGGCAGTTLLAGGAGSGGAYPCYATAGAPPGDLGEATAEKSTAEGTGAYDSGQLTVTREVIAAAESRGLGPRAQAIGVMTAIGESTLRNLDHGDAAGPDSRGAFQQRAGGAWGSYQQRMTPRLAARAFFDQLATVPGWDQMPPSLAAHRVQHNADPWHYEPYWDDAVDLVAALSDDPDAALTLVVAEGLHCASSDISASVADAEVDQGPQGCTEPDPTGGRCLTPRTAGLATYLVEAELTVACQADRPWAPRSDHNTGRACDVTFGTASQYATGTARAAGDQLAAELQRNAEALGIAYLIWYGRIWSASKTDEGWRPYTGGGIYDRSDATGGHFDHVHISMR